MARPKVAVFELDAACNDFKSKSKDIFGVLQTLEDKHSAVEKARKKSGDKDEDKLWKNDPSEDVELVQKNCLKSSRVSGSNLRQDDRKQDGFRKPYLRPPSHRKYKKPFIPDYKKHPERYTCYSLDDVSSTDMSDSSNSRAAFDFLDQRKKLREQQERGSDEEEVKADVAETACSKGAFTFKKRNKKVESDMDSKISKPTEKSLVKISEADQDIDISVSSDVSEEIKDSNSEGSSFKRRKTKQRNIRAREDQDHDDDDET